MLTNLLTLLGLGAAVFIVLSAFLYLRQESIIFYPAPNDPQLLERWASRKVQIPSANTTLEGWWIDNDNASSSLVLIYFGGNAEDILYTAQSFRGFNVKRALLTNYRGYGATKGKPGQQALFQDALAIYDYVVGTAGIDPAHVVVMGRSLGSGVATMLAAQRAVLGAILITPFDSLKSVAARHYFFMPVHLLLRHPFPSDDLAKEAKVPVLIVAGASDMIIPPLHAQRLYAAWAGQKEIHILPHAGHNDIELHPQYEALINRFLQSIS